MKRRRKYRSMSYAAVLRLFAEGRYALSDSGVGNASGELLSVHTCHRGYRYVRFYHAGRRRAVSLHRLVWMLAHQRTVPPGAVVHHLGDSKARLVPRADELVLMHGKEHEQWHADHADEHAEGDAAALREFLEG